MSYLGKDREIVVCGLENDMSFMFGGQMEFSDTPFKNSCLVSECEATHCRRARALQTRFETCAVRLGGERRG